MIKLLEPVVRSKDLKDAELGRVWLLLGASYRAAADYKAARQANDSAMRLVEDNSNRRKEYAIALR